MWYLRRWCLLTKFTTVWRKITPWISRHSKTSRNNFETWKNTSTAIKNARAQNWKWKTMHMKWDLSILAVTQGSDHVSFPMKNQGRGYVVITSVIRRVICTALCVRWVLAKWRATFRQLHYVMVTELHKVISKDQHGRSSTQTLPFSYLSHPHWLYVSNRMYCTCTVAEHCSSCLEQLRNEAHVLPTKDYWAVLSHFLIILPCITYLTIRYNIMGQSRGKLASTAYTRYTY